MRHGGSFIMATWSSSMAAVMPCGRELQLCYYYSYQLDTWIRGVLGLVVVMVVRGKALYKNREATVLCMWQAPGIICISVLRAGGQAAQPPRPAAYTNDRSRGGKLPSAPSAASIADDAAAACARAGPAPVAVGRAAAEGMPSRWIHSCCSAALTSRRSASSRHRHVRTKSRPSGDMPRQTGDSKSGSHVVTAAAISHSRASCRSSMSSAHGYSPQ
mmetsp:Transcript_10895/g.22711  ORF Transcript_10895/g.22711 Transcript_10895/m.22711 type:complete len:216 (+) Transcript_10895:350-997(+)